MKRDIDWEEKLQGRRTYIDIKRTEGLKFLKNLHAVLRERGGSIVKIFNENPDTNELEILRELRRITEMIDALSELIENPVSSDLTFFFQQDNVKNQAKLIVQPFDLAYIFTKLFSG